MRMISIKQIAPAKGSGQRFGPAEVVWHLTLDQIEANTGRIVDRVRAPAETAGGSTCNFDERNVLYSKLRPYLNKVICPDEAGIATTELVPLRPIPSELDRQFLCYYLRSPKFVHWISNQVSGAKMPRVNMKVFWDHQIPLPPLDKQVRIAAMLDKADVIRSKRAETIRLADDFLKSTFLDMFGDPVTNPKAWSCTALKWLTTKIGSGATPRGGNRAYQSEGTSLIRSLNIHDDELRLDDLAFINNRQAAALDNVIVESGDVLLNITGASVCRCAIVTDEVLPARVNQHVTILRTARDRILPEFLLHQIINATFKQHLIRIATSNGATREALTKKQLEDLEVCVPPLPVQKQFAAIVRRTQEMQTQQLAAASDANDLFQSLTQRAFRGDL